MKKFVRIFSVISFSLILFSCTKEEPTNELPIKPLPEIETTDGMTVLGKQLENPYSVCNMRRAFANLTPTTRAYLDEKEIETTHYYVKFHPKNDEELDLLKQDSTLILYSYPLDYDIEVYGTYYHDPEIPDSLPTYQYASVDVNKWKTLSQTSVEYTILEELFIPDESKDNTESIVTRSGATLSELTVNALVDEALRITGNYEPEIPMTRASKWRPSGRITTYDDVVNGAIPLVKVRVRARRWFTTHIGYTNSSGYFSCDGTFKRPANYSIVWESSTWDIRNGWFGQAYYNGPKITGDWNLYITNGNSLRHATIHRAAYRYYFGNIYGFARPANFRKEKICYLDEKGTGDYWANMGIGILPDIRIYGKENKTTYKSTDYLFRTTIHELAHAAHCTWMTKIQYWQVSKIIYESWADFVEWYITQKEYGELGKSVNVQAHQYWPLSGGDLAYSSLFIDLVDTYNQGLSSDKLPFDEVSGFPTNVLNVLLLDSYGLESLKKNVKLWKPSSVTDSQIDNLFKIYENTKWK